MMPCPESACGEAARGKGRRIRSAPSQAALFQPNGPGARYPVRPRQFPGHALVPARQATTTPHTSQKSEELITEYQIMSAPARITMAGTATAPSIVSAARTRGARSRRRAMAAAVAARRRHE